MRRLAGPRAPVTSLAVSPDGRWLGVVTSIGGPHPRNFCLWDLHGGSAEPANTLAGQALHVAFAPDSDGLVLASPGQPLRRYTCPDLHPVPIRTNPTIGVAFFAPDKSAILGIYEPGGGNSHLLFRYPRRPDRHPVSHFPLDLDRPVPMRFLPAWPDLSPDGTTLATVARPTEAPRSGLVICLWDLARRKLASKFSIRRGRCESLHFAPDGRRLAAVCNHQVLVWDVVTRKRLAVLDGPPTGGKPVAGELGAFALWAAFAPDGRHLFVSFNDRVCVFDTATWAVVKIYAWAVGSVLRIAVTPDGLCAVAAGNLGEVVVWDLDG